uniref:Uncharacterized protein n=1 Tax=Plectus sambesii TaxID=2011161 RepID=A0A914W8L6_9BILA
MGTDFKVKVELGCLEEDAWSCAGRTRRSQTPDGILDGPIVANQRQKQQLDVIAADVLPRVASSTAAAAAPKSAPVLVASSSVRQFHTRPHAADAPEILKQLLMIAKQIVQ